jgi:hypothetical protein
VFYLVKIVFQETKFEGYFQTLFYKGLFLIFKRIIFKSYLALCKQKPLDSTYISKKKSCFDFENLFPIDLKTLQ